MVVLQTHQYSPDNLAFSLCASQGLMDTGVGGVGGFNQFHLPLQQQQQQQQQRMTMQQNQLRNLNQSFNHSSSVPSSNSLLSMPFPSSLDLEVEKQRYEIDRFVASQNERLRSALQEQRKKQLSVILRSLESKTQSLLRQKDEDIAKATRRTMELEDCLSRIDMENQTWQRVAKENESMVIALNNTLEQVRDKYCRFSSVAEDAESCCDFSNEFNNKEEERTREAVTVRDEEEEQMKKMVCKGCNSRSSCVLFLPCRHLCSCKSCEAFLHCCPVCNSAKKASIEVLS